MFDEIELDFDRSSLSVTPLTCSSKDTSWSLKLPTLSGPKDWQRYKVEMKDDDNFVSRLGESKVILSAKLRSELTSGDYKPEDDKFEIEFKLTSDKLGEAN